MADPFIAQINITAFDFPPRGWARCDGQLLPINQNQALFSLLGTTYGGDGRINFALPDLRGRGAVHRSLAPSNPLGMGERFGSEAVTLVGGQLPAHTHTLRAGTDFANGNLPDGALPAARPRGGPLMYGTSSASAPVAMNPGVVAAAGNGQPHNNMQPYAGLNFVIALQGIFPARN